jgi:hypothetical protein
MATTFSGTGVFANEISMSRAKDQTKNKKPEKFIEDARKIFVGGIPNQVTLGWLKRGVQELLPAVWRDY